MASIQMKFFSKALKTRTNVNVLLPTLQPSLNDPEPVTSPSTEKVRNFIRKMGDELPVLYLLHGTFGDEGDWQRFSRLEDYARNYRVVIVMPQGENSSYRDMPSGQNYGTYIADELPQLIEWAFPVSRKREDRFICGLSMGGAGAYKIGLSHPDRYGYVASLSGGFRANATHYGSEVTIWSHAYTPGEPIKGTAEDPCWLADQVVGNVNRPALYMACGSEDFLFESNQKLDRHLNDIGYEHAYSVHPGVHNWDFWDDEIQKVLAWLPIDQINKIRDL